MFKCQAFFHDTIGIVTTASADPPPRIKVFHILANGLHHKQRTFVFFISRVVLVEFTEEWKHDSSVRFNSMLNVNVAWLWTC